MKKLLFLFAALLLLGALFAALILNGTIQLNHPSESEYPVRGVDVSHYQGEIDFSLLEQQGMRFAFIKATEGSTHVDSMLQRNMTAVQESGMRYGFYHFFSFDSPGSTQAENFIANVPALEGMLPPVIDLEFYGDKAKIPPIKSSVDAELRDMIDLLTEHYGMPPIIYATEKSYALYLEGGYADCDIWIRNVVTKPHISDDRPWTFWQFTNRGRIDGYNGRERFIDINVFSGGEVEFTSYPRYNSAETT